MKSPVSHFLPKQILVSSFELSAGFGYWIFTGCIFFYYVYDSFFWNFSSFFNFESVEFYALFLYYCFVFVSKQSQFYFSFCFEIQLVYGLRPRLYCVIMCPCICIFCPYPNKKSTVRRLFKKLISRPHLSLHDEG